MSKYEYSQIVQHIKFSHKTQYPKLFYECKKQIEQTNLECYCAHLKISSFSKELTLLCVKKCSSLCLFCQFSDKWLNNYLNNLTPYEIKSNIAIKLLVKKYCLLNNLLSSKFDIFKPNEILKILKLDKKKNVVYPVATIKQYLYISNKLYKLHNCDQIEVVKIFLQSEHIFEYKFDIFFQFVKNIIEDILIFGNSVYLSFINKIINNELFIDYLIQNGTELMVIWLIDNSNIVWTGNTLPSLISENILNYLIQKGKIINPIQLMSNLYKNVVRNSADTLYLTIIPSNIFESIIVLNPSSKIKIIHLYLSIKIIYQSSLNNIGMDIGGLSRDLFTNMAKEFVNYLELTNTAHYIITSLPVEPDVFTIIGNLLCRSIFEYEIIPSINLHPVFTLAILRAYYKGHKSTYPSFDIIKKYLLSCDIEEINNILKLEELNFDSFKDFLELQEETSIHKSLLKSHTFNDAVQTYILNVLYDKYVGINGNLVANGFAQMLNMVAKKDKKMLANMNLTEFYNFITREHVYDISSDNKTSLKSVLKILAVSTVSNGLVGYAFKIKFIEILEELNKVDKPKLKNFFKFWFGTHSISNFSQYGCEIRIVNMESYVKCFKSSTCFGVLDVNNIAGLPVNSYKQYILNTINMSLENQRICEEANLYIQLM